ncbi:MAG: sigma-70 family RNA polymerase sigma factor [Myxococcales bacterium]|nr:sigma-70 family RNA polymerase sigma factor [Myxococcales bacterium]
MIGALFARWWRSPGHRLAAAARGNASALSKLYDEHVDGLYAFVFYRVGGDASLAEDVVQETFTCALRRRDEYDPARGSIASWLSTLSRNVIRDQLRAHRRGDKLAASWDQIDQSLGQIFAALAEAPLPGEVLLRHETRDLVHMAIANLPETYRTALTRKYIDGDSIEQLAASLGLTPDAAKSLLARARRAFREAFSALSHTFSEAT